MRSSSLARVVMVSLGVSMVITLGCGRSSGLRPSPQELLDSLLSIVPTEGPSAGATVARIEGIGVEPGATVTVDGSRVDSTVLSANAISLTMPAHAAGNVDVTVINPLSQTQVRVRGGYTYFGAPVISELVPNSGSTAGGVPLLITGTGVGYAVTVKVDGILTDFEWGWPYDEIYLSTPAHTAGTVEVILTDRWGQAGRGQFTYASPATFDFNGNWEGWARLDVAVPSDLGARLVLTIRNNIAVSVSCSVCRPGENCAIVSAPSLPLDPPPVVANGEFSSAGSGGVSITGKILSPIHAVGSINTASCGSRYWWADKKS